MSAKSLAELALKVWGVIILVGALTTLPASLAMIAAVRGVDAQDTMIRASQVLSSLTLVFHIFVGAGLIVWCDRIVDLIVPDGPSLRIAMRVEEARVLAFAVVGLSVLIDGVQNAAVVAYTLYSKPSIESQTWSYLWARQRDSLIKAVVQLAAGFLLLGGREFVVNLWTRLRGEPLDDGDDPEATEEVVNRS